MCARLLDEIIAAGRGGKPRSSGVTIASDPFGSLDTELLEQIAEYIDFVKIGMSTPLLVDRSKLQKRVGRYHDLGISVVSGGTLTQVAVQKDVTTEVLKRLNAVGFDMIEISESAGRIPSEKKRRILDEVSKLSMDYIFEVGMNDSTPVRSLGSTISRVQEAFELKSDKVIIGISNDGTSGLSSHEEMPWDALNEIAGRFGPPSLIFKAPRISQRTALILEFGPEVNLAGVPIGEVHALETQRLGLTAETLGLSRLVQNVEGSPAAKFVYHLIRAEHPIDQPTLIMRSGLPKRTVQAALGYLVSNGSVRKVPETTDMRRYKYTPM
jgi:phosphosulfolactate synthase